MAQLIRNGEVARDLVYPWRHKLMVDVWVIDVRTRSFVRRFMYSDQNIRDHSCIIDQLWFLHKLHFNGLVRRLVEVSFIVTDPPSPHGYEVKSTSAVTKRRLADDWLISKVGPYANCHL